MIAAFIFVISTAALVQFGVFTWRAGLLRVASEPLADQSEGTDMSSNSLNTSDFNEVLARQELCPDLNGGNARGLRLVRVYYSCMRALNSLGNLIVSGAPGFGGWTQREMALCARYTAVVLSQRLQRNQLLAEEARSF
ncbi:MAG: hypothetical protein WB630_15915 [Candidatus Acidiferrales bacterium]